MNTEERYFCFEMFGYDFIIDDEFKVWLIEVNTNPCLEESSSILKTLLPRMLDDMMKLTIDQVFPPRRRRDSISREIAQKLQRVYRVAGYPDDENMWECLCQLGAPAVPRPAKAPATAAFPSYYRSVAERPSVSLAD